MRKSAAVLEIINDESAKIMLHKQKRYFICGLCGKHLHQGSILNAANPVRAKEGEMVDVNVKKQLTGAELTFTYILPVMAFFFGLFLGGAFFIADEIQGYVAVTVAFASLAAATMAGMTYKKNNPPVYKATIIKIVKPEEPRL